jgi:hypothetical protein
MLSLSFIRENRAVVAKAIADKNVKLDLDELLWSRCRTCGR